MLHESRSSPRQILNYLGRISGPLLDRHALGMFEAAMSDMELSARAYDRILKVARTLADLKGSESITPDHIGEAVQYRSLDRQLWT